MRQHHSANGSLRAGSCTSCMPHRQIATSGMALLLYISKVQKHWEEKGKVSCIFFLSFSREELLVLLTGPQRAVISSMRNCKRALAGSASYELLAPGTPKIKVVASQSS